MQLLLQRDPISILVLIKSRFTNNVKINFPGYIIIRKEFVSAHYGGAALLFYNSIQCEEINLPENLKNIDISPGRMFPSDLLQFADSSKNCIIMGDLNVRNKAFGGHADNASWLELHELATSLSGVSTTAKIPRSCRT